MSATLAYVVVLVLLGVGALGVLLAREALRLTLSLGVFLLGVAASFLYFGLGFLAVAQVFVYVGGVLVLVLFALMIVRRAEGDRVLLGIRFDWGSAATALSVAILIIVMLLPEFDAFVPPAGTSDPAALAQRLLGGYLVPFEIAGGLLLVAVLAVLAIVGKEASE
ncbi:MAG: NADH-quinone oxidoreductase subunit J [Coriobacteriia bacterium]|nr:NADH-quinone oxidoreductase subunit J [Coriobacteriia bacterium]